MGDMKVLVAENNPVMLKQLRDILDNEGYQILSATNGTDALKFYHAESPEFVCLDIMMEDLSGYDVCKEIRKKDIKTPIIFISAKSRAADKVIGLEMGADDYIVKPFDVTEVMARIRAITRRCIVSKGTSEAPEDQPFWLKDLKVTPRDLHAERDGKVIELNLRDIKVLRLFHDNKGKAFDRNTLLDRCWGTEIVPESRIVDWHISQLRRKIEKDPAHPEYIKTIHRVGYKFEEDMAAPVANKKMESIRDALGPDYLDDHVQNCLNEMTYLMGKIFEDFEHREYEHLQQAAHDMKGVAGSIGMKRVFRLLQSIEKSIVDKKYQALPDFIPQIAPTFEAEKQTLKVDG
jgi:DNA-binding response OmpR family regulator